jgi:succinyl-diaminopimelate desuccinylase
MGWDGMGQLLDVVELTHRFVAIPSPNLPGDEREIATAVQDVGEFLGLGSGRVVSAAPDRPNVLIDLDFGPGGRHLALSGHLDTKPIGDAVWDTDPFTGTIIGEYMYGLGTCDMKGAVAAMLIAAARASQSELACGRLTLVFTADEEYGSKFGSRFLAEEKLVSADAIVIGEPGGVFSDWDQLNIVSRGIANIYVDVFGDQGHSSLSEVRGSISATQELAKLLTKFSAEFKPRYPVNELKSKPTVNAGVRIEGGVGFGVVPGLATFSSDVRLIPGMTRRDFEDDLKSFLLDAMAAEPRLRSEFRFEEAPRDWLPPTQVESNDPVIFACQAALEKVRGNSVPLGVFPGTTDACWLQGLLGIPTLPAFGPGMLERAHAANERISISSLNQSVDIYEELIRGFCGASA